MPNPADDGSAPATRADVQQLMAKIDKLYDAGECWKDEVITAQSIWKDEVKGHFDSSLEHIRADCLGANNGRAESRTT